MSRAAAALLAAAVGSCCAARTPDTAPAAEAPRLRLVVLVIVDQWPSWGFEQRRDLYEHGLGRLLREGQVLPRVAYPYAGTFTAAGHATMATGATPSVHGMIANHWWGRDRRMLRSAELDDDAPVLGLPDRPATDVEGASGKYLRVDGIADALRAGTGGKARSVVIGGKSRAGALVGGRRPDVALWYEPKVRGFTTSTAFAATLPPWALALDRDHPIDPLLDDVWGADDPEGLAKRTGIPDDAPGEEAEYDLGRVFPHRLGDSRDPAKALRATPLLDHAQIDAAIAAIAGEHLGADDVPDLLIVSLSSHDYAGHNWGQESWEMIEHERALDRELARLLDALDAAAGAAGHAVIVTSDHGATPMIERGRFPGARRIPPDELHTAADIGAAAALGPGTWIETVASGMIYLSPAANARPASERAQALEKIARAIEAVPQVERALVLDAMPADCGGLDEQAALACASRVAGESGEILVVPERGSFVTSYITGTSHDALSDENRFVPVILRVPGNPALAADRTMLSLAPTLAALLGVPPPEAATAPTFFTAR